MMKFSLNATLPTSQPRDATVWRNPSFRKLWVGQAISKFGSHITSVAMAAVAVLALQATPAQMGVLGTFEGLSALLLGLLAGVWVDRLQRRPILIVADLGRALVLVSIPLAALFSTLSMPQLYVVTGLVGTLTVLYNIAHPSYLPSVVTRADLVRANALIGASDAAAEIAGPSLAGTLVQWLSAPYAISIDVGTYLFSAICLARIHTPEPRPMLHERPNMWREMIEGLRIVIHHPVLRALAGTTATHRFFGSFIGTIYWLFLVRDLGLSPAIVGVTIGVGGVGAFIGTLVAPRITRRMGVGRTLIASLIVVPLWSGFLLLPITTWPTNAVIGILFVIQLMGDIFWSIFFINVASLRQAAIPTHLLGRASASLDVVGEGATPLGALVGGAVATVIGARWTWLVGAAGILVGSLWLILSPVRQLHALPSDPTRHIGWGEDRNPTGQRR
jgi:predicted MFS family arabinose efflux permease